MARRAEAEERSAAGEADGAVEDVVASVVPSWLLRGKVVVPPPAPGYVFRPALLERIDAVLQRRLTVLQAPAGFGKTTVLADVSRRIRTQGRVVGWLTLDGDDTPSVFVSYIAYAFEHAGLDLTSVAGQEDWSSAPIARHIGMLARAIERHAAPCLLVLDELERLPRQTVGLIDLLLKRAPPNLHFAAAFRSNPGLDLAAHVLDGFAIIVGAPEFRFSKHEIAQFFKGDLSRRKLAAVEKRTAGWPVALMVYRNMQVRETGQPGSDTASLTSNFVGVRVLRDLSAEDRTFLLDLALFDWIEADLVDEVLGSSDGRLRIAALSALDGLLLSSDSDDAVQFLHPLVREYCVTCFAVEDAARKRTLHARIARALASRGQLTPAWRHASAAGDSRLVGELIESVGVIGLWAHGGITQVVAADRFLTPEIVEAYPRLALLRCVVLNLALKLDEASALYETVARRTQEFTRDRDGGDADALIFDRIFTQAVLAGGTCRLAQRELEASLPKSETVAGDSGSSSFLRAVRHALYSGASYEQARFEESRRHGLRAKACLGERARYGDIYLSICLGMAAMAQGRPADATDWYRRARQGARKFYPSDTCLAATTDIVTIELDLERNREKALQQRTLHGIAELRGGWIDIHAAAVAVHAELTLEQYNGQAVVKLLNHLISNAPAMGIEHLSQYLSALLASYLVETGHADEAAYLWRDSKLPSTASELVDLETRSWRTMEALSSARARLLIDQGDFDTAGEITNAMYRAASSNGLVRTAMRTLILSLVAAHHRGQPDLAVERMVEFISRARDVDYVRPLVRHRDVSLSVLQRLLGGEPDDDLRTAAESMLASLGKRSPPIGPEFTSRELEILGEVRRGWRNKEIAEHLAITDEGVRYHLKKIYRKTGVSRRNDAVRYALNKGALS
ncbi:MAG: LuxR C-terminal-related transcriptional regulator [Acidobacteria bacterium]|nr:LuxR C-terminal-related transcriptional regulator [Acidobacteriota bacterium]